MRRSTAVMATASLFLVACNCGKPPPPTPDNPPVRPEIV
jgi:hypothetical protein